MLYAPINRIKLLTRVIFLFENIAAKEKRNENDTNDINIFSFVLNQLLFISVFFFDIE